MMSRAAPGEQCKRAISTASRASTGANPLQLVRHLQAVAGQFPSPFAQTFFDLISIKIEEGELMFLHFLYTISVLFIVRDTASQERSCCPAPPPMYVVLTER
jgi:hypothetical protein